MEPFYFRKASKPLLGIYHPPKINMVQNVGVVLCYPMGQEYIRSYRSLVQLARLLSSAGIHVLRFDYYGCGDSDGDCTQGSFQQWIDDILAAVNELDKGCGLGKVCLAGLRLGATLAMIAGTKQSDIDSIILWDPVTDGKIYLEESISLHNKWLQGSFAKPQLENPTKKIKELLGFPMTDSMREELVKINLLRFEQKPANNILIIETDEVTQNDWLKSHLQSIGVQTNYEHIPSAKIWHKNDMDNKGLVPTPILQRIVAWISEVY